MSNKSTATITEEREALILQSESSGDPQVYYLPDGRRAVIGKNSVDFLERVQSLPAPTKIQMMKLTSEEMSQYIKSEIAEKSLKCIELIKKDWYFRESGSKVTLDAAMCMFLFEISINRPNLLKKLGKQKIGIAKLNTIINCFEGPDREFYTLNQE